MLYIRHVMPSELNPADERTRVPSFWRRHSTEIWVAAVWAVVFGLLWELIAHIDWSKAGSVLSLERLGYLLLNFVSLMLVLTVWRWIRKRNGDLGIGSARPKKILVDFSIISGVSTLILFAGILMVSWATSGDDNQNRKVLVQDLRKPRVQACEHLSGASMAAPSAAGTQNPLGRYSLDSCARALSSFDSVAVLFVEEKINETTFLAYANESQPRN